MLKENGTEHTYREYTREPLTEQEVRQVLAALERPAVELLRKRDPAFKTLSDDDLAQEDRLVAAIAEHPTLLERPIGVVGTLGAGAKAVVGRPPERLLDL